MPLTGLLSADGTLYGTDWWPGRLFRIDSKTGIVNLVRPLKVDWVHGLARDGDRLWFLETSNIDRKYGAHCIDIAAGARRGHFNISDARIAGIAFGRGSLWISSLSGIVYQVDPAAMASGKMEGAVIRSFKGYYDHLSFSGDTLWGLDIEAKRFCRICLEQDR